MLSYILSLLRKKYIYAIVDIDWCISDERIRRSRYMDHETWNIDWKWYFDRVSDDAPFKQLYPLLLANKIIFLTWRNESTKKETMDWINRHFPNLDYSIMFRPDNNRDSAPVLKENYIKELINRWIMPHSIAFAIDDDINIIEMYKKYFIKTIHIQFYI